MPLAPILLEPRPVARPWGGRGVEGLFDWHPPNGEPTGEWWTLSTRLEAPTIVAEGPLIGRTLPQAIAAMGESLVGCKIESRPPERFPLLLKILDAEQILSVQLHPSDSARPGEGKTEAWMILSAAENSSIYLGLADGVGPEAFFDEVTRGSDVRRLLRSHSVSPGDVAYIPAGRIHAFGPGVVALEIQQNSDTTYRIYDWNRKPERTLHVSQAREVVMTEQYAGLEVPRVVQQEPYLRTQLIACPYFHAELIDLANPVAMVSDPERCWIVVPLQGSGRIEWEDRTMAWRCGAAHVIPAALGPFRLHPTEPSRMVRVIPGSSS